MSLIEGIGDDLLYAVGFLIFLGIVSLAWLSSHVTNIHLPTTLFIIERRTGRNEESTRAGSVSPPRSSPVSDQTVNPSSGNETQTEHDSDNDSSENDEFVAEQVSSTVEPTNTQSQCRQTNPTNIDDHQQSTSNENDDQTLRVIIKFLNETRKEILANPNDTISKLKQLHFADDLANNKLIRFIYQGRELQDRETLRTCNIRDQTTIHCQITTRRNDSTNQRTDRTSTNSHAHQHAFDTATFVDASPINISSHFIILLTAILGIVWYLRIKYRFLFSPMSTVILVLMTLIFLIFTCGSFLSTRRQVLNTRQGATTIAMSTVQHIHLD